MAAGSGDCHAGTAEELTLCEAVLSEGRETMSVRVDSCGATGIVRRTKRAIMRRAACMTSGNREAWDCSFSNRNAPR
jgi:hypothetical protein